MALPCQTHLYQFSFLVPVFCGLYQPQSGLYRCWLAKKNRSKPQKNGLNHSRNRSKPQKTGLNHKKRVHKKKNRSKPQKNGLNRFVAVSQFLDQGIFKPNMCVPASIGTAMQNCTLTMLWHWPGWAMGEMWSFEEADFRENQILTLYVARNSLIHGPGSSSEQNLIRIFAATQ